MTDEKEPVGIINKFKSEAIESLVNTMIGAFESGYVEKNNPTLSEIYRVAQNHIKDNYGVEIPNIDDQWGKETAERCGLISK